METAGAEEMPEDVERKGIGTPATRAAILENRACGTEKDQEDHQSSAYPGGQLPRHRSAGSPAIPLLTADWEQRLGEVERGELSPEDFMAGITAMLTDLVRAYQNVTVSPSPLSDSGRVVIGKCPRCGKNVVEGKKSFYCEGYHDTPSCGFALWKNDRFFTSKRKELTKKIAASLLKNGRVVVTGLFSEKKGVFYDATVVLNDDGSNFVRFKLEFDNNKSTEKKGK